MKEIFRIFLVVFLEVFFLSYPFWAKFITDNPLIFPPEDKPLDWLMFGATYYGVAASFLMIFYTSLSLKQNRKQLDEMKRQWKEDHKPEIIAYLVGHEGFLHLCVKNISAVPVKNICIEVTHVSDKENFPLHPSIIEKINAATFSIEPSGCRYINTYVHIQTITTKEDYLGLKFTFNENNEYCVNLPFQVASFVTSDLDDRQFQNDIHQISRELQKLANKK